MTGYISEDIAIDLVSAYAAANTTDVPSSEVDMDGYDGVCFVVRFGTANDNNLVTLHDSPTAAGEAATVAHIHTGSSPSNKLVILDVRHPRRYVKAVASRGTSSTLDPIVAIRYRARVSPVTNAVSGTSAVATFMAPAPA